MIISFLPPNFLFLGFIIFMIPEMEMLDAVTLSCFNICTVSRDVTNTWPEKAGLVLCVYSHIPGAIHCPFNI